MKTKTALGLAVFVAACVMFLIGCGNLEDFPDEAEAFRATFGSKPGSLVTDLQAHGASFRDSSHCYLRFKTTEPVLTSLAGPSFVEITRAEFEAKISPGTILGPTPKWWTPLATAPSSQHFLESSDFHPNHTTGTAYMSIDPADGEVFFYWDGLD